MSDKKGFTLIEVIVITLIIAALAMLVAPSFRNSALTNEMEKAKIGLVELTMAVKLYNEINALNPLFGVLKEDNFKKLTRPDSQGYTYLQNPARWVPRSGSADQYSLRGINCKYTIGQSTDTELTKAECKFQKDEDDEGECYKFSIFRANPAVIKKERLASCDDI